MPTMASNQSEESHETTLADLIGLEVYTISGQYVGRVEDARLDFGVKKASGLALTDVNPDVVPKTYDIRAKQGIVIPYRWVHSVGDVVTTSNVFTRLKENTEDQ